MAHGIASNQHGSIARMACSSIMAPARGGGDGDAAASVALRQRSNNGSISESM